MLLVVALEGISAGATERDSRAKVAFDRGSPALQTDGDVAAAGSLKTARICRGNRAMRLLLTDHEGDVLATIDRTRSSRKGRWKLRGLLPEIGPSDIPTYVKVRAADKRAGKVCCKAAASKVVQIAAPA